MVENKQQDGGFVTEAMKSQEEANTAYRSGDHKRA